VSSVRSIDWQIDEQYGERSSAFQHDTTRFLDSRVNFTSTPKLAQSLARPRV
jgi:hypothetical protein